MVWPVSSESGSEGCGRKGWTAHEEVRLSDVLVSHSSKDSVASLWRGRLRGTHISLEHLFPSGGFDEGPISTPTFESEG